MNLKSLVLVGAISVSAQAFAATSVPACDGIKELAIAVGQVNHADYIAPASSLNVIPQLTLVGSEYLYNYDAKIKGSADDGSKDRVIANIQVHAIIHNGETTCVVDEVTYTRTQDQ